MIDNQKHLFDIPDTHSYLDCAANAPLLSSTRLAGERGLNRKYHPWEFDRGEMVQECETVRGLFADLIGANAGDIAVVSSTAYAIATAAQNLPITRGQNIIILQDQFPSNVYAWLETAKTSGADIITVDRPSDNDWTSAVLEQLNTDTAIATLPHCHWTDGRFLDLVAIGKRCRELGAALVIDSTQSTGAHPMDVREIQPDFIACSAYKWLLCPYTLGFLYAAPHRQSGNPLESHNLNHGPHSTANGKTVYCQEFTEGARRYDMGESFNHINIPMAIDAMTQLKRWGVPEIHQTLCHLIDYTADKAAALGWGVPNKSQRIGHFIGMMPPSPLPDNIIATLRANNIYLSARGAGLRVSPHLFNSTNDIDRLFDILSNLSLN